MLFLTVLVAVSAVPQSQRLSTSRRGGIAAALARSYGGSVGGGSVGGGGISNVAAPAPDKPNKQCNLVR